jgi:HK97 family phage major capsid protein
MALTGRSWHICANLWGDWRWEATTLAPVSLRLLRDAATNPSVEQVVRTALRLDLSFLQGSGTGGEPLGIKNMSGVTAGPSLGANGRSSFDDLKAIPASLRALNAPFQRPGWIFPQPAAGDIRVASSFRATIGRGRLGRPT